MLLFVQMVNLWFSILRTIMAIVGKLALGGAEFCQPCVSHFCGEHLKFIKISFMVNYVLYINEG